MTNNFNRYRKISHARNDGLSVILRSESITNDSLLYIFRMCHKCVTSFAIARHYREFVATDLYRTLHLAENYTERSECDVTTERLGNVLHSIMIFTWSNREKRRRRIDIRIRRRNTDIFIPVWIFSRSPFNFLSEKVVKTMRTWDKDKGEDMVGIELEIHRSYRST